MRSIFSTKTDLRSTDDRLSLSVVPSEDAHGSEYVAACDRRREWISGCVSLILILILCTLLRAGVCRFNGSAGQAIVSKTTAYLVTDSRYWLQAQEQLDSNWRLVQAGHTDGPKDWIEWLVVS